MQCWFQWLGMKHNILKYLCLVIFFMKFGVTGDKILIVHPLYAGSHELTLTSLSEKLTENGHQVHILRWKTLDKFPKIDNPKIFRTTLSVNNSEGKWTFLTKETEGAFQMPYDILWNSGLSIKSIFEAGWEAFPLLKTQCETLLSNSELLKKLKSQNFKLAILDVVYNECGLALLHHLKLPVVGYWAMPFVSGEPDYTTAFLPASHVPQFMSSFTDEMNFSQRVWNSFLKLGSHAVVNLQGYGINSVVQKYLPGTPHPLTLLKEFNGMLINSDYTLDYPRLLPPTFINVGGIQIRTPKPLPPEIEQFMESSGNDGVILFTMGFIFRPEIVPKTLIRSFLEAFRKLPQKVLMKYSGEIENVPKNVKVLNWIPQQDVLGHPKVKLFLTHCGLHGVMEAIYFGVPMVAMPIFIDQGDVLTKLEKKGVAVGFDKDFATKDIIYKSLNIVLKNTSYKSNAMKLSNLMRDRKDTPLERSVSLIEYLLRHNGAEHLKLSSRSLNFIQYFCIDTLLLFVLIFILIIYFFVALIKLGILIIDKLMLKKNIVVAHNTKTILKQKTN